jgi:glycosyltransferase involved in cell wall biosynthesis
MKIALITASSNLKPNGRFHNVINRVKYLRNYEDVDLDAFLFRNKDDLFHRLLFNRKKMLIDEFTEIDGIKYRNLWLHFRFVDSILTHIFGYRDIMCKSQIESFISLFSDYDIILAHSIEGKYLAYRVKERFSIPYINGWHGSDLNITPFKSRKKFKLHKQLINAADYNLFVSKKLLEKSNEFTDSKNRTVSYSGVSSSFFPFERSVISQLKEEYNLSSKYIIGYVGNFRHIKNVLVLPAIFKIVQNKLGNVGFVLVGDERRLSNKMKRLVNKLNVKNILFMGRREKAEIPKIMNCFDLLILPSLKEGLPLVTLEALACGIPVVGSNVGGIPESIGEENSFELNDDFENNISNRIIQILENNEKPEKLSDIFSWEKTIKDLVELCKNIVSIYKSTGNN